LFVYCVCFSNLFIKRVIVFSIVVVVIRTLLSEINIFDLICTRRGVRTYTMPAGFGSVTLGAWFQHTGRIAFKSAI